MTTYVTLLKFTSEGPEGITDFGKAWEEAFKWLVNSGHECADRPCYEMYLDDCCGPTCRFDICIPLKTK